MIPLQRVPRPEPPRTAELPTQPDETAGERWWVLRALHAATLVLAVGVGLLIAGGVLLIVSGGIILVLLALSGLIPFPVGCAAVIVVFAIIVGAYESDHP